MPLIQDLNANFESRADQGKKQLLEQLLERYSKLTYFQVFGVSEALTAEEKETLKTNYKQLALKLHPDKASGKIYAQSSENLFKLVSNAYETLDDPEKRQTYLQQLRPQWQSTPPSSGGASYQHRGPASSPAPQPQNHSYYFYSSNTNHTFTYHSGAGASQATSQNQSYNRDILANENISGVSGNITINGNVYGHVSNMSGNIIVYGDVYGHVTNMSGNITVYGNVSGSINNTSGNNTISRNVDIHGKVSNTSGSNVISGCALGQVTNVSGTNIIYGRSDQPSP